MEEIEYYNSNFKRRVKVFIPSKIAERCRLDTAFAEDLFTQLQDQNVEEGSSVEIETIKAEIESPVLETPSENNSFSEEITADPGTKAKEAKKPQRHENKTVQRDSSTYWTRQETLLLVKLYEKLRNDPKMGFSWSIIAKELNRRHFRKSEDQCRVKWNDLMQTHGKDTTVPINVAASFQKQNVESGSTVKLESIKTEIENHNLVQPPDENVWTEQDTNQALDANIIEVNKTDFQSVGVMDANDSLSEDGTKTKQVKETDDQVWSETGKADSYVYWTRRDTLLLIKLYEKLKNHPAKKFSWSIVARELNRRNSSKTPYQCRIKWCNMREAYRRARKRNGVTKFEYFREMQAIFNHSPMHSKDQRNQVDDSQDMNSSEDRLKLCWTANETLKLIELYKKYKERMREPNAANKDVWLLIAAELNSGDTGKDWERCRAKWQTLMRGYRRKSTKFYFSQALEKVFEADVPTIQINSDTEDLDDNSKIKDPVESFPGHSDYCDQVDDSQQNMSGTEDSCDKDIVQQKYTSWTSDRSKVCWTPKEALKLIELYKKYKDQLQESNAPNKNVWSLIAKELNSGDPAKDWDRCKCKWKSLMKAYRNKNPKYFYKNALDQVFNKDVAPTQNGDCSEAEDSEDKTESLGADSNCYAWSFAETCALINVYGRHRSNFNSGVEDEVIWKTISADLRSVDVHKSPVNCEQKWKTLYLDYRTNKNLQKPSREFRFFRQIDKVLTDEEETKMEYNGIGEDGKIMKICKCLNKKMLEKNRRHREKMLMLKRKLDLEERKVSAFKDYVSHLRWLSK